MTDEVEGKRGEENDEQKEPKVITHITDADCRGFRTKHHQLSKENHSLLAVSDLNKKEKFRRTPLTIVFSLQKKIFNYKLFQIFFASALQI